MGEIFCDNPGSASNSPKTPIIGDPFPYSATKAVSTSPILAVTVKPASHSFTSNTRSDTFGSFVNK